MQMLRAFHEREQSSRVPLPREQHERDLSPVCGTGLPTGLFPHQSIEPAASNTTTLSRPRFDFSDVLPFSV
jgi:hypothetical protein